MKRTLLLVLALVFALSAGAFARSLGLPNELINGSWESGDDMFWARQGGEIVNLDTWFAAPGPAPGQSDVYGYGLASCWGTADGSIYQDVYVMPGIYEVDLSGWLQAKDGYGFPSWIELQLLVDDVLVGAEQVSASGSDTGWVYKEIRWTGFVAGKKTAKLVAHVDGREGGPGNWPWGIVYADGIDLEEQMVPEPASILALVAGLGGLVIRRRK
jgi:hypothetical protein